MKKIFILLIVLVNNVITAQENTNLSFSPETTEKIYNYITKGYKIQLDSGLDIGLKGYTFGDDSTPFSSVINLDTKSMKRVNTFKLLYEDGKELPCAIMMITRRLDNDATNYYCIPSARSKSDLWLKFRNHIFEPLTDSNNGMSNYEKEVFSAAISYYFNSLQMISYTLTTKSK